MSPVFTASNEPLLCILPPNDAVIHRPYINLTDFLTSYSICLNSYEERIDAAIRGESLCAEHITNCKEMTKSSAKRQRQDSGSEKKSPDSKRVRSSDSEKKSDSASADESSGLALDEKFERDFASPTNESNSFEMDGVVRMVETLSADEGDKDEKPVEGLKHEHSASSDESNALDADSKNGPQEPADQLTVVLADIKRGPSLPTKNKRAEMKATMNMIKKRDLRNKDQFRPLITEEVIQKIRQGWTVDDVGDITIGDLYLMFGQDSVVRLEYKWVEPATVAQAKLAHISCSEPIDACENAEATEAEKNEEPKSGAEVKTEESNKATEKSRNTLSNRLQQLLMLANMMEKAKKKTNCLTCHNCNANKIKKEEMTARSFISNKTYQSSNIDKNLFRQPVLPSRSGVDTYRLNLNVSDFYDFHRTGNSLAFSSNAEFTEQTESLAEDTQ